VSISVRLHRHILIHICKIKVERDKYKASCFYCSFNKYTCTYLQNMGMPQKHKILSLDTKYKMQSQCFNQMDQEILIQLKRTTKKNFIVEKIRAVDRDCEFQVNLKMSINWLSKAWDKVTQTYIKVFHKSLYNISHKVSLKIRLRFIVITIVTQTIKS
jgi:hypothetical protein